MLSVGRDATGPWAAVQCDRQGCEHHVAVRPGWDGASLYELGCEAFDYAESTGWGLSGRAYCPEHVVERPRRRARIGDGFSWVLTRLGGGQGPS